tara:strand:+ start:37208 stop:38221 length:1014 start_codon:yes stop_codon:yes gene_type:complete
MAGNREDQSLFARERKLSRFLVQEMLYDYVTDQLDKDRHAGIAEFLKNDEELQSEEKSIRQALEYCEELGRTEISEPLSDQIGTQFRLVPWLVDKLGWSQWPDLAKWSVEAFVLSGVVAIVAVFLPWDKLGFESSQSSPEIVLLEKEAVEKPARPIVEEQNLSDVNRPASPDLIAAVESKNQQVREKIAQKIKEENVPKEVPQEKSEEEIAAENRAKAEAQIRLEASKNKERVVSKPKGNPFLYRGSIGAVNLDTITPQIANEIKNLGGKKGGKVEIGWRKPNASYFHFIVNEEHLGDIKKIFGQHGELQIKKTPHRRVMPSGKIRFIIELKDNDVN